MSELHIFRGLPGSGKTTAARKLSEETGAILIEPDALLVENGKYLYGPKRYQRAFRAAVYLLQGIGKTKADIIFADVLPTRGEVAMLPVFLGENERMYQLFVHDLKITAEESLLRNRHNVRPEDIERMASEWEDWEVTK